MYHNFTVRAITIVCCDIDPPDYRPTRLLRAFSCSQFARAASPTEPLRPLGQFKRVIEFAVGKQTTIGRDVTAVEFQLRAPIEIDPGRLQFHVAHRARHDRSPSIVAMY